MLAHWYVTKAVKAFVSPVIAALEVQRAYLTTFNEVIR